MPNKYAIRIKATKEVKLNEYGTVWELDSGHYFDFLEGNKYDWLGRYNSTYRTEFKSNAAAEKHYGKPYKDFKKEWVKNNCVEIDKYQTL